MATLTSDLPALGARLLAQALGAVVRLLEPEGIESRLHVRAI